MKIKLGYVSISKALDISPSKTITYTQFLKEPDYNKINRIIVENLTNLDKIINYNIENNIHFYRLTSNLIPLATLEEVKFDYLSNFQKYYKKLAKKLEYSNMRVDMHPDQFCVLNSTKKEVVENAIKILQYHYDIMEALQIKNKILILHVGSSVLGKQNSISRFIHNFNKLPLHLQKCIAVENDDKTYNAVDCLELCKTLKIPMILDYHHHICNSNNINISDYLQEIFNTWTITPKVHFSSPKNHTKKDFRSHHDYIDVHDFIDFLNLVKPFNIDLDIMIEAKAKDDALFRLIRQLKYYHYQFIDDTTFEI